ncbi:hypothetical protein BKA65DRAFT_554012 [Rhexocercosporidium sp. MPI-PUGE-AT-0058]|nr:hypothetical protein BKA65DRAFT_554012 [Rhexocercosporidium sp. MPI-PUGE-AT-0058]
MAKALAVLVVLLVTTGWSISAAVWSWTNYYTSGGNLNRRTRSVLATILGLPGIWIIILLNLPSHVHASPVQLSGVADGSNLSLWSLALTATLAWTLGHVGKRAARQSLSRKVGLSSFFLLLGAIALCAIGDSNGGGAEATIAALTLMLLGAVWSDVRSITLEPPEDSCPNPNCTNPDCDGSCRGAGGATGGDD